MLRRVGFIHASGIPAVWSRLHRVPELRCGKRAVTVPLHPLWIHPSEATIMLQVEGGLCMVKNMFQANREASATWEENGKKAEHYGELQKVEVRDWAPYTNLSSMNKLIFFGHGLTSGQSMKPYWLYIVSVLYLLVFSLADFCLDKSRPSQ